MYGTREEVTLAREVTAIQIPDGNRVKLAAGTQALITQELGASFTVMTEFGAMYRIDQKDADALGKEVAASDLPEEAPSESFTWSESFVWSEAFAWSEGFVWSESFVWSEAFVWSDLSAEALFTESWIPQE